MVTISKRTDKSVETLRFLSDHARGFTVGQVEKPLKSLNKDWMS